MSSEEHHRAAKLVHEALSTLNSALRVAQEVGLHVEIVHYNSHSVGRPAPCEVYVANCETRERVPFDANLISPQQEKRE